MLRVMNTTDDFAFIQWDQSYRFTNTSVEFVEYFDLRRDPWQQVNAWSMLARGRQTALNSELERLYACEGEPCAL